MAWRPWAEWAGELRSCLERGETAVLVTVVEVHGSSPRTVGTHMLVTAGDVVGTVGGGSLELEATRIARAMPGGDEAVVVRALGDLSDLGPSCGGRMTMVFDRLDREAGEFLVEVDGSAKADAPTVVCRLDTGSKMVVVADGHRGTLGSAEIDRTAIDAARRADRSTRIESIAGVAMLVDPIVDDRTIDLVLFGAGHVGRAIVAVLGAHPDIRVTWVDDRPDIFPDPAPEDIHLVPTGDPAGHVDEIPGGAYVVVASHGHALDFEIAERVLSRGDARYCGLIGSATKRAQFEKRWRNRGLADDALGRLVCPIGIGGITGRQPADIAVAVAAQILTLRDAGAPGAASRS